MTTTAAKYAEVRPNSTATSFGSPAFPDEAWKLLAAHSKDVAARLGITEDELLDAESLGDSGAHGTAFALDANRVLKVTNDSSEADAASLLIGQHHSAIVDIYDVFRFEGQASRYGIVMERLEPLTPNEFDRLDEALSIISEPLQYSSSRYLDELVDTWRHMLMEDMADDDDPDVLSSELATVDRQERILIDCGVDAMMEQLIESGINFTDYHPGNIMRRRGQQKLVVIDLGMSISNGDVTDQVKTNAVTAATTPLPHPIDPNDPGLLTLDRYLQLRNPTDRHHPGDAYDSTLKSLNPDFQHVAMDQQVGYRHFGLLTGSEPGYVITSAGSREDVQRPIAVLIDDVLYIEKNQPYRDIPRNWHRSWRDNDFIRLEWSTVKVVKYLADMMLQVSDVAKHNRARYPHLLRNLVIDGEALQVRSEAPLSTNAGITVVVVNAVGQVVAMASDEWGATLLRVAQEYRGKGLGQTIGRIWSDANPRYGSGGFTDSGRYNAAKLWAMRVREYLERGWYSELMRAGTLTRPQVDAILRDLPQRPAARPPPPPPVPADTLIYVDDDVSFIIYDAAFYAEQDERHIHAYGFFRADEHVGSFLFRIDYDRPYAKLATLVALQMARDTGEPIYIGEGYGDLLETDLVTPYVTVTGDYVELKGDVLPLAKLARLEASRRKPVDQYGEMKTMLIELAEGKWS